MSNQEEYIAQLMSEKLARVISPEDEHLLDGLMAADPALQQHWERYKARYSAEYTERSAAIQWKPLPPARKRMFRLKPAYYTAAAAVAGIAVLIAFWPAVRQATAPSPEGIHLTLANGRQIDLSGGGSSIQLGGTSLQRTDSSLHYTSTADAPAGMNKLQVPVGKDYKITLEDGTVVWLNAASRLDFPFAFNKTGSRRVAVSGEAYFEVAPDAVRPFVVETERGSILVLGTSFNINTYNIERQELSLISGSVQLKSGEHTILLKPGRQVLYGPGKEPAQRVFDAGQVLSWQQGVYYFEAAGLEDICTVLPRWYGTNVVLDNKTTAAQRFTGRLNKHRPLSEFLEQLKTTTTIDYYFDEAQVLHFR